MVKRKHKLIDWGKLKKEVVNKNYTIFLKSRYWKEVRKLVLKRDNYRCIICGNRKELVVHHQTYNHHFKEHAHLENLDTLCRKCHTEYHETIK